MPDRTDVLVAGAGPTGLTVACCLARGGARVRVVEQRHDEPGPHRGSRGTGYQVRTLEVFDDLGVVEQALASAWTGLPMRFYSNGILSTDMSLLGEELQPTPEVPYPTMARPLQTWQVEQILTERLVELGGRVEYGRRLVRLDQTETDVIAHVIESASDITGWGRDENQADQPTDGAGREEIRASYLVGCDGGRSTVRNLAGLRLELRRETPIAGLIADLSVDGVEPTYMRMWVDADGRDVVLSPQYTTRNFQFIAQVRPASDGTYPSPTLEVMQKILDERAAIPGARLRDMTWGGFFRVREALADSFRTGRVFLAGDAAHIHSPTGGQGANTGIQDGYNLGWKLAYVLTGRATEDLLESYEPERRPVAETVLEWSAREHSRRFSDSEEARTEGERLAADPEAAQVAARTMHDFMNQMAVRYADSLLNLGSRAPASPSVGERAPDGKIIMSHTGERLRLFDLFRGDHFTILLFDPALVAFARAVEADFGPVVRPFILKDIDDPSEKWDGHVLVDPHRRAAGAYAAAQRPIVLVRPDGYIAFHGSIDERDGVVSGLRDILHGQSGSS